MDAHRQRNILIATAVIAGHNLLRQSVARLQHGESSDEEDDRWFEESNLLEARIRNARNRRNVTRIEGYVAITIYNYTGQQFREHFRLTRRKYENLEEILAPHLIRTTPSGRCTLDVRTQLLAVLWLLATPDSYR